MSNTNHDFLVKNGLVVGQAITSTGTLTQAGQTFPASDGSAGQYLKTNGSGALSWGTVSTSFNITDGTTTDTVGLTETVTFTGGTNISLAVTDNTVTITNDVVDSDDITEGSSNLFYTDARAVAAIQGASNLTIDGGTLYVDTAADRVGISDTSPQQKLDVAGNIGVNGSEVIDASGNIVGSVADSAMTVGGSLAGVLSNLKVQYGTAYSGTPIQGSFFFDSLNQKLKVYTGSAFIDAVPAGSGGGGGGGATDANTTFRNYSYTLTGTTSAVSGVDDNELTAGAFIVGHKYTITSVGNTDFTAIGASGNTVGVVFTATGVGSGTGQAKQTLFYDTTSSTTRVVAYVNGIKQVYGSGRDFVATTGTSVAFTYNLGSGDTVDLQVYELLTNDAYYLKSEVYTQTEVNSQISTGVSSYLPLAGGTLTGDLILSEGSPTITLTDTDGNTSSHIKTVGSNMELHAQHGNMRFRVGSSGLEHMRIAPGGDISFYEDTGTTAKFFWDASAENIQLSGNDFDISAGTGNAQIKVITATGDAGIELNAGNTQPWYIYNQTNDFRIRSDNTDYLSIRTDGNVGIGGAAVDSRKLMIHSSGARSDVQLSYSGIGSTNADGVQFGIQPAGAYIWNFETATNTGDIYFGTGNSRKMTLNTDGDLKINHTGTLMTLLNPAMLQIKSSNLRNGIKTEVSNANYVCYGSSTSVASSYYYAYMGNSSNSLIGTIVCSTSGVTYNTTSDRRLKDNIEPIADATDKLMTMKPVAHTWIDDPDKPKVHGFIAQEMQEVIPEAVSGDAESDEMMSMDYGRITPVIVAALQDALNEIKELKTRIDELENK